MPGVFVLELIHQNSIGLLHFSSKNYLKFSLTKGGLLTKSSLFNALFAYTKPLSKDGKGLSKSASKVAIVWTLKKC